jgi:hypothetical protein
MKNKKNILILLMILGLQQAYCQSYKFKTTSITLSEKNEKEVWSKWTAPQETNIIIALDTKKDRIVIYSSSIQLFEIMEYIEEKQTEKQNILQFVCKDNLGEDCNISIITHKNQGDRMQLYVTYEDRIINYNIEIFK